MALNNKVELTGNIGSKVHVLVKDGKTVMSVFSLATQDSHKNKEGNWKIENAIIHNIMIFDVNEIEKLKNLKIGAKLRVTGSLSYRDIKAILDKDRTVIKQEAYVIADSIEPVAFSMKA